MIARAMIVRGEFVQRLSEVPLTERHDAVRRRIPSLDSCSHSLGLACRRAAANFVSLHPPTTGHCSLHSTSISIETTAAFNGVMGASDRSTRLVHCGECPAARAELSEQDFLAEEREHAARIRPSRQSGDQQLQREHTRSSAPQPPILQRDTAGIGGDTPGGFGPPPRCARTPPLSAFSRTCCRADRARRSSSRPELNLDAVGRVEQDLGRTVTPPSPPRNWWRTVRSECRTVLICAVREG